MGKREAWLHTWPALRRPLLPLLRYPRAKRFAAGGHEALYECLVCTCPGLGWVGFTPLEEEEGPRARALLFEDTARRQPSAGGKSTLARHPPCWYLGPGHPVRRTMRKTITFGCLGHQSMVCFLWQPRQTRTRSYRIRSPEEPQEEGDPEAQRR